jgi:predicted RNA-binding Zn-ribbon protein involved in translation (DUF1610 family)
MMNFKAVCPNCAFVDFNFDIGLQEDWVGDEYSHFCPNCGEIYKDTIAIIEEWQRVCKELSETLRSIQNA